MAKWRVVVSVVTLIAFLSFGMLYEKARGPLEGRAAVLQLEDSDTSYIAGRSVAEGAVPGIVSLSVAFIMIVVWGSFSFSALQVYMAEEKKKMDEKHEKQEKEKE